MVSIMIESLSFVIYDDNISVLIFSDLLQNVDEAKFGLETHLRAIVYTISFWLVIFGPLFMRSQLVIRPYWIIAPIFGLIGSYFYTEKNANVLEFLPANTSIVSRLIVASRIDKPDISRKRANVDQTFKATLAGYRNIVVILDESVRSDYLQVNGFDSDNTPFLSSRADLINFGTAVSYANCSAHTRAAIRSMAKESDFPDPNFLVLTQPTFWQYAKLAGYRTIYIDGWLQIRPRHSFLTLDELSYVDKRTSVSLAPFHMADQKIAEMVRSVLAESGKKFIFVEKIGLHSPYAMNLADPAHLTRKYVERPALSARQNLALHEYVEGVYLKVDKFFQTLLGDRELKDTIVLYTSDHGQAAFDGNYDATHCTRKDTVRGEGMVPMFAFASENPLRTELARSASLYKDKAAQSDLPATLLRVMGFPASTVEPVFGKGLFEIEQDRKRRFFSGNPFVKVPVWTYVDE